MTLLPVSAVRPTTVAILLRLLLQMLQKRQRWVSTYTYIHVYTCIQVGAVCLLACPNCRRGHVYSKCRPINPMCECVCLLTRRWIHTCILLPIILNSIDGLQAVLVKSCQLTGIPLIDSCLAVILINDFLAILFSSTSVHVISACLYGTRCNKISPLMELQWRVRACS